IYGSLFSVLKGNPFNLEILVDSWPNYGAVMTRPLTVPPKWDPYMHSYSLFVRDESCMHIVLEHMNWNQAFEIQSMQEFVMDEVKNEATRRNRIIELSLLKTYYQNDSEKLAIKDQDSLEFCCLSPAHSSLVDDSWSFGGNYSSKEYVTLCLKSLPSCCILKSGSPLSWVLCDHYGAMRMLYTVPQERRKGLGSKTCSVLANILQEHGRPVYCHVEEENIPSQLMFKSLGFQETTCKLIWAKCNS
ncbi:hypothetical protein GDO86_013015, partial [Hymenochirus boettgeri]